MSTETLSLTNENVEKVLDELRPFLISDGGNVEIAEIDGPIVKVRLQGACVVAQVALWLSKWVLKES